MGNDRISDLPDCLITQILLGLPTKDSVKTSVLSTRWRKLWLDVPGLDLDPPFPNREIIKNFTEGFFEFNKDSRLQKFKMINDHGRYNNVCSGRLKEWIATAVDSGIQHLDFETKNSPYIKDSMPMNIYKSKTLVSLKLGNVWLENPEFVVSLPCLKIMHLKNIWSLNHHGPLIVEKLISGCPVLEDLILVRIHDKDLQALIRVRSLTLKTFDWEMCTGNISVEIDAPKLKYMSFRVRHYDRIVMVKNLSSLFKIDLGTGFGGIPFQPDALREREITRDFLTGISSVRHMTISLRTLEVLIHHYSKFGPIPEFQHLSHLKVAISSSSLQQLPTFLESFPNLKNFILELSVSMVPVEIDLTSVPRCMTSTLEYIEINKLIRKEATGIKLVNYFLENTPVLKKLKLSFTDFPKSTNQPIDHIFKMYLTTGKHYPRCQVIIS